MTVDVLVTDGAVLVGRLATVLACGAGLTQGLDLLVDGLRLRSAVLRSTHPRADLLAVSGEVVHAVPAMRGGVDPGPRVELPVPGGREDATLTVVGARPSQLPALRAAAAVLGLALSDARTAPAALAAETAALLHEADEDGDLLADALHDGPMQSLVVARYACDAAVGGGDPAVARDAVQDALVTLRRTLWQLRPRGGDGLAAALSALSARGIEAGRPPLRLVIDADAADRLAPTGRMLAYRLVQAVARDSLEPVQVVLRTCGSDVSLEVDGGVPLPRPERWCRRVRALSGDLAAAGGGLRLLLPAAPPPEEPGPDLPALRVLPRPLRSTDVKVRS